MLVKFFFILSCSQDKKNETKVHIVFGLSVFFSVVFNIAKVIHEGGVKSVSVYNLVIAF